MLHNIELSESSEEALREIARASRKTEEAVLQDVAEIVLAHDAGKYGSAFADHLRSVFEPSAIRSRIEIMGGDACIRDTRIPVWLLVRMKQTGWSDERILKNYPGLTLFDLLTTWDFYAAHATRVEAEGRAQEEAA